MGANETKGQSRSANTVENSSAKIPPNLVQQQLDKILAIKGFVRSERLSRFLRFTVTATLQGESDKLKEYAVGLDVFDRDSSYDPRIDPIVRVEARLLRTKLEGYYADEGKEDAILIEIPTGGYVPAFRIRKIVEAGSEPPAESKAASLRPGRKPGNTFRFRYLAAALVLLIIAALASVIILRLRLRAPSTGADIAVRKVTSDAGLTMEPALSPDGRLLAYASDKAGRDNLDIWIQQTDSGQSLQLTNDPADESEPNFSPDGMTIVFRSEKDGGGIYIIPAIGGEARLLASKGRQPRFSPDGQRVLYWTGMRHTNYRRDRKLYLIPATGGLPVEVHTSLASGCFSVWFPDGKHFIFWGFNPGSGTGAQWYVMPADGGSPEPFGLTEVFRRHGLVNPFYYARCDICVGKRHLAFPARLGDSTNLWQVEFSPETFRAVGDARRLTFGAGMDANPSIAGNRLTFTSLSEDSGIWALPADTNRGQVLGTLQPLVSGSALNSRPSLSSTGEQIAFISRRDGNKDVWIKDRRSGKEINLTRTPLDEDTPAISRDGRRVAYANDLASAKVDIHVAEIGRIGNIEKLCENCGVPSDWSADGKYVIYTTYIRENLTRKMDIAVVDVASHKITEILTEPQKNNGLWNASFSPDDRWIAFVHSIGPRQQRIYIAPFHGTAKSDIHEWIPVTDGSTVARATEMVSRRKNPLFPIGSG